MTSSWINRDPNPQALPLLCFPAAGQTEAFYSAWRIPGIDVLPVVLPGRGSRARETPLRSMRELATAVVDELLPRLPERFALFGHSMGAWLAHAVAVAATEAGQPPERLFVVSAPPPHLTTTAFAQVPALPDTQIVDQIIALGGAAPSDRRSILAGFDPLRADLDACASYRPIAAKAGCPVTVIAGDQEPLCSPADLAQWRRANDDVAIRIVEGGHFLPAQRSDAVIRTITRDFGTRDTRPIAIIGMACKFPQANNLDDFWELLTQGRSAIGDIPADRVTNPDKPLMTCGGFIDGVDKFDAAFFGFSRREAHRADPRLRLLLMATQDALDNAHLNRNAVAGPRTGVFVGETHSDYWDLAAPIVGANMYTSSTGGVDGFLSGRLAHFWDLQGPAITIDTACAASLTAVHLACQSLRSGETDLTIAGGAQIVLLPDGAFSAGLAKAFSPTGRSAFASADADGCVRGDGIGVIVLKRLADALADGDPIHAVIEGSVTTTNGQSGRSVVTTSATVQARMMRAALAIAGLRPADIGMVEAHGTGTPVGDTEELRALHEVYGTAERPCFVGSVKTNIGHLEASAGIAGLIKTVLSLEQAQVPPSLGAGDLSPAIDWSTSSLRIPKETVPFPDGQLRRAAVSSFGLSGTNVHMLVSAAPTQAHARERLPRRGWNTQRYWYTELAGGRAEPRGTVTVA